MSRVDFKWSTDHPPAADVYTTRRNQSTYLTLRYWDGKDWFEIAYGNSRGGIPMKWPKRSRTRKPKYCRDSKIFLRKISARLGDIRWGEPFKVFDEKEVLAHLVKIGHLPLDWRTRYQDDMRA